MTALRATLVAALVCLLPVTLVAEPTTRRNEKSDAEVKAEIAFARGLAADWAFVDLAEKVIEAVEEAGTSDRMGEELDLVKCDVYAIGARNERDPMRRNELFEGALEAYRTFMDRNRTSSHMPAAEAAYVDTSAIYARALEASLEEAVGDEFEQIRERQRDVLEQAATKTAELITALQSIPKADRTGTETLQLYALMLNRGRMLAELSKTQGEYFRAQALKALENLVFEAGEGTPWALRAYVAMGNVYAYSKEYEDAISFYEAVIGQTIPLDPEEWAAVKEDMTNEARDVGVRFLFLELASGGLMDAYSNVGRIEEACKYGLHYINTQRVEGMAFTPTGYISLLAVARALLDSGGYIGGDLNAGEAQWFETQDEVKRFPRRQQSTAVDMSLRLTQSVNDDNRGNRIQVLAQKLISEVISRPGVQPSPQILYEAAQGEYYAQDYMAALDGFHRVLTAIDAEDRATRIEYGARVMNHIANSYRKMDRTLEAAMAFREGATAWKGDIEFDPKNAQGFYRMITAFAKTTSNDKADLEALVSEAEQIVANSDAAAQDEVLFNLGKKAYRDKDYDKAKEHYSKVPKGSNFYEKASVEQGVCLFRKGDIEGATRAFTEFLEVYLESADAASTSASLLTRRKEAVATAEFYRALGVFMAADESGDRAGYQRVVDYVQDFYTKHPEQNKLVPWTMQMVVKSHLGLGDRAAARDMLTKLVESYPDAKKTSQASIDFYKALNTARDAATDADEQTTILREMAQHLERSNAAAASPSFTNLRNESRHWMELAEYENASKSLGRILTKFEGDEAHAKSLRDYVIPDLGECYIQLKRLAEAKAVLDPIVVNAEKRPAKATIINWCMAVTGWLEGSGSKIERVPGAGSTDEEFQLVVDSMSSIAAGGDKWVSCDWYYHKYMVVMAYYVWGQQDSRKLDSAKNQLGTIEAELDAQFTGVDEYCSSADTPADLRETLGQRTLQLYYQWLRSELR
jgi:tetratricopeptide (TPR) repeat protein